MAQATLTITVRVAWWVQPYLQCCAVFASLFGMTPDFQKIGRTITTHGIRFKVQR